MRPDTIRLHQPGQPGPSIPVEERADPAKTTCWIRRNIDGRHSHIISSTIWPACRKDGRGFLRLFMLRERRSTFVHFRWPEHNRLHQPKEHNLLHLTDHYRMHQLDIHRHQIGVCTPVE